MAGRSYGARARYRSGSCHAILNSQTYLCPHSGSLFNHSPTPNTSYTLKTHETEPSIEFTVLRRVEKDQELCIFYGDNLWFTPDYAATDKPIPDTTDEDNDPFDLLRVQLEDPEPEDSVLTSA